MKEFGSRARLPAHTLCKTNLAAMYVCCVAQDVTMIGSLFNNHEVH
jgi:hypothetical protein